MPEDFGSVKLALKNMSEGQSLFVSRGEYRMEASKASNARVSLVKLLTLVVMQSALVGSRFTCCTCFNALFVTRGEYRMEASKASKAQQACFTCCTCFS